MYGKTRKDKIRNEGFRENLEVAIIRDKIRENQLRWFGHVQRRTATALVRKSLAMKVDGPSRRRDRPKRIWIEVVKINKKRCRLSKNLEKQNSYSQPQHELGFDDDDDDFQVVAERKEKTEKKIKNLLHNGS